MLHRHQPTQGPHAARRAPRLATPIALLKAVRRDVDLLNRCPQIVEHLAERLRARAGRWRLRSEQAREYDLRDLPTADRWWKEQWQQRSAPHGGAGREE